MLELQSAGNVRVEEATDDCTWQATCSELLQSRFDANAAEAAFGCRQIKVTRVARIHNRPLRLRFDAALEGEDYNTEYMFWVTGTDTPDWDTATIAQQGVPEMSQLSRCAQPAIRHCIVSLYVITASCNWQSRHSGCFHSTTVPCWQWLVG